MSCGSNISIIIPVAPKETAHEKLLQDLAGYDFEIITHDEGTRAISLNKAAEKSTRNFLWFLHADSRVSKDNVESLMRALKEKPDALHFFKLAYIEGGLANLNAHGANIRSCLFKLPYGDQGFCISKKQFERLGMYPEIAYGEDLIFIRKAKAGGVKLIMLPAYLKTSARRYHDQGWLKLTAKRQLQMIKLLRQAL